MAATHRHLWNPPGASGGGRLVALLALFALALACVDAPEPRERPEPGEITFATFNLYFPAADDEETVAAVGATGADIIVLQEVSPRWREVLEQRYAAAYPYRLFAPARGASGLGVLSRHPLASERLLRAVIKHPAWLVRVETPAGELTVLNVHLRASRRPGQSLIAGLFSASSDHERELRAFLEAAGVDVDVIAGDFNEGPRGGAVAWLSRRGFVDALGRHRPRSATFRALGGLYSSTLDHVLLGDTLRSVDAWVLHQGNSDHWPVIVRLRRSRPSMR